MNPIEVIEWALKSRGQVTRLYKPRPPRHKFEDEKPWTLYVFGDEKPGYPLLHVTWWPVRGFNLMTRNDVREYKGGEVYPDLEQTLEAIKEWLFQGITAETVDPGFQEP